MYCLQKGLTHTNCIKYSKNSQIGANFLSRHCDCNNPFVGTIKAEELQRNLRMVERIGRRHGLENLVYTIEYILLSYN